MMPFLSFATLCLAAPIGYAGLRASRARQVPRRPVKDDVLTWSEPTYALTGAAGGWRRGMLWACSSLAVLAAPWGLPDVAALRFIVAVCSVLAFMRLTETWLGKVPANTRQFSQYFWYFTFFGDIRLHPAQDGPWGRAMGVRRLARGTSKAVAVLGLFVVATAWRDLWDSYVLRSVWCLWAGYFGATGTADLISGLQMVVSGHGCAETFVLPILARSPGDFWGRRWNLVFRNAAHRVVFQRTARRFGASAAGAAVFIWSIVAHEYLVVATLGRTRGEMALFFGLQGVMTLVLSRIRRGQPWPTFVAIGAHWLWMIATSPLFFVPIFQVFPVDQWVLW